MKPKILLIEDDPPTIQIYEEAFRISGLELEVLNCGEKAMERFKEIREGKKEKPNLILLDIILPDVDGLEILKEAKRYSETKDLKIFALTNYTNPELNKELIKEGIDKILVKTEFTPLKLAKFVKKFLAVK